MGELKNTFSWSKSRDALFNECKRKYYFEKYAYWGGWNKDAPERVRELYILKNLISKEIWIGQVVHDIIERILSLLKSGNEISLGYALNILRKRLNEDYNNSKGKLYKEMPKKAIGLFEHEYGLLIPKDVWNDLFKKAEKCITNFYNSDTFQKIKKLNPKDWLVLEDFASFDFEGTEVFLKIDFAVKKDGKIIIFDWKTGRERFTEMDVQLCCYALYMLEKYDIEPEKIIVKKYNAALDKEDESLIDVGIINKIKGYMGQSIKSMKDVLTDEENNVPKGEEEFSKMQNFCSRCKFKKICLKDNLKGGE